MHLQIGSLKKGINPPSFGDFVLNSPYFPVALKTGIITGVIAMAVSIYFLKTKLASHGYQKKSKTHLHFAPRQSH